MTDIATAVLEMSLFILLLDTRQPEYTKKKTLAFLPRLWHLQKHTQTQRLCKPSEVGSTKVLQWTIAAPRLHPFHYFCLICASSLCFVAGGWSMGEKQPPGRACVSLQEVQDDDPEVHQSYMTKASLYKKQLEWLLEPWDLSHQIRFHNEI